MKYIVTKVPPNAKLKRDDVVNCTGAQYDALVETGHELVTETERDAIKAREDMQAENSQRMVKAQEAAVDGAIAEARKRGTYAPKEDVAAARSRALKLEASEPGLGVSWLNEQPVKAAAPAPGSERVTATSEHQPSGITMGAATLHEVGRQYVTASEPMTKLIRAGDIKGAMELSRERASILGSGIRPLLRAGGDVRFRDLVAASNGMSHTEMVRAVQSDPDSQLGTVSTGLLLTEDLGFLVNKLSFLKKVSTDFSDKPARFGEPIYTRYKTPPNVLTYVAGVGFTSDAGTIAAASAGTVQSGQATQASGTVTKSVPSTADVVVTLNQLKSVDIEFGLDKLASTVRNYFAEQKPMEIYALAEQVANHFMSTVYGASWTGTVNELVKSLSEWDLKALTQAKSLLTVSKVPDLGRFALLHTFYHDRLLEDPAMLTSKAILSLVKKDQSVFEQTQIPDYAGITPLETNLASSVGSTITAWTDPATIGSINKVGFLGNMSSMVFVSRVPQDFTALATELKIPATASVEIVTEPESGLSMMFWRYMDLGKMSIVVRACLMWGDAQGDPRVGIVLKPS